MQFKTRTRAATRIIDAPSAQIAAQIAEAKSEEAAQVIALRGSQCRVFVTDTVNLPRSFNEGAPLVHDASTVVIPDASELPIAASPDKMFINWPFPVSINADRVPALVLVGEAEF